MSEKACAKCGETKPLECFKEKRAGGLYRWCNPCSEAAAALEAEERKERKAQKDAAAIAKALTPPKGRRKAVIGAAVNLARPIDW